MSFRQLIILISSRHIPNCLPYLPYSLTVHKWIYETIYGTDLWKQQLQRTHRATFTVLVYPRDNSAITVTQKGR